jgi:hypothetical protein
MTMRPPSSETPRCPAALGNVPTKRIAPPICVNGSAVKTLPLPPESIGTITTRWPFAR